MKEQTAILVLAAGEAKRMGKPKQLLPFAKNTLLEHCLSTAINSDLGRVYCVLGAHFQKTNLVAGAVNGVRIIQNSNWQSGMGSSITCGLNSVLENEVDLEYLLVLLADQPLVPFNHLQKLAQLAEEKHETIIATKYPNNRGVPAVFPKSVFNELIKLEPENGAKKIIQSHGKVFSLELDTALLFDIDTAADYQRLMAQQ